VEGGLKGKEMLYEIKSESLAEKTGRVEDQTFETLETADLLDTSWTRHDGWQGWIRIVIKS